MKTIMMIRENYLAAQMAARSLIPERFRITDRRFEIRSEEMVVIFMGMENTPDWLRSAVVGLSLDELYVSHWEHLGLNFQSALIACFQGGPLRSGVYADGLRWFSNDVHAAAYEGVIPMSRKLDFEWTLEEPTEPDEMEYSFYGERP